MKPIDPKGLSDSLLAFTNAAPWARGPHIAFIQRMAASIAPGETVLDVGAGDAPYRELFSHANYKASDWDHSLYAPEVPPDLTAHADRLPVADASIDAILNTQVLEHVPEPSSVLREFFRVLRPGGMVWLTAPLVWFLHELPYDYYRYTPNGLEHLLTLAGFRDVEIVPMNDAFSTLAQLMSEIGYMMGAADDGRNAERAIIARTMGQLADLVASFSEFDTQWILPINYAAVATRPDQHSA